MSTFTIVHSLFKQVHDEHWHTSFVDVIQYTKTKNVDSKDSLYIDKNKQIDMENKWLSGPYRIWQLTPEERKANNLPENTTGIFLSWDRSYPDEDTLCFTYYFDQEQEARDFYNWYTINMVSSVPEGGIPNKIELLNPEGTVLLTELAK